MATFDDTPKWMKRDAYERNKDKPMPKRVVVREVDVICPKCRAPRGVPCEHHRARRSKAKTRARQLSRNVRVRIRRAQDRRWATVDVRFVCPICGGDHSRADHDRATDGLLERARKAQR